jgi:ABC-type glycerol-3-phosphate transport system permease component
MARHVGISITGTILVMITSSLAAYSFARLTFPGRDGILL